MNGYWKLRNGSDLFPRSKYTNSFISNISSDIYFIQSILSGNKSSNEKVVIRRFQNDDKQHIHDHDLGILQYKTNSSNGSHFCTLLESDYKFEQLIFLTFGPASTDKR